MRDSSCTSPYGASQEDVDAIRSALKNAKGRGNFRNLFLHSPNGKKEGVQIIPLSEVAAKDGLDGPLGRLTVRRKMTQ